jgi:hypothetical protein
LDSPTGLHSIFYKYIQPRFKAAHEEDAAFYLITSKYRGADAEKFAGMKVKHNEEHDKQLRNAFEAESKQDIRLRVTPGRFPGMGPVSLSWFRPVEVPDGKDLQRQ